MVRHAMSMIAGILKRQPSIVPEDVVAPDTTDTAVMRGITGTRKSFVWCLMA